MPSILDNLPTANEFEEFPKIELHLHLTGSVSIDMLSKLSGLSKDEVANKMIARGKIDGYDFTTKTDFANSLLQTKENLYLVSADLVDRLAKQNVVYAEIRLTPMLHLEKGLSYDDVIESVISGLNTNPKVKTNLILCMLRGATQYMNAETLKYALKYLGKGVCALDILGDEIQYPLKDYMKLFELAALEKIPYTIHAGRSVEDMYNALILHTKRISNGIKATFDIDLLRIIYYKKILLELSPSNDVMLDEVDNIRNHPINFLEKNHFNICVNTDSGTISNVNLSKEYKLLSDVFNFTIDDFKKMNLNAINSSFMTVEEKEKYSKLFK